MRSGFRSQLYAALGRGFDDPTDGLLYESTENPLLFGLGIAIGNGRAEFRDPFDRLWIAISELRTQEPPAGLDALRVEHTRLFHGPPTALVSPYEHAYRAGSQSPDAGQLARTYAGSGLSISEGFKDLADHVCLELEFMSHLLQYEERNQARAGRFRTDHLLGFLPAFAVAVGAATRSPFYRALADALACVVRLDHRTECGASTLSVREQTP